MATTLILCVCFISVYLCYSTVNGDIFPTRFISGELTTTNPSKKGGFAAVSPYMIPAYLQKDHLRYTRSIFSLNMRDRQTSNEDKLPSLATFNPRDHNQDPAYSRAKQVEQQKTFMAQSNFNYRPAEQELREQERGNTQQKEYVRPLYPAYDGSFAPPISQASCTSETRNCPYCNSPLPPEPGHQLQTLPPRPNQSQQNPQLLRNHFNQNQQYSMLQRGVNINPVLKMTETNPSEEICLYNSGSPQEEPQLSTRKGYNLQQSPDVRGPPSISNPSNYMASKNFQAFLHGPVIPKNIKARYPIQQTIKNMKVQRTVGVPRNVDSNREV